MNKSILPFSLMLTMSLIGCGNNGGNADMPKENRAAKELLWGTWLKDDDGSLAFTAKGDTIYNPDPLVLPVCFYIRDDSLVLESTSRMSYKITKQSAHIFRILNQNNEEICYVKSDGSNDEGNAIVASEDNNVQAALGSTASAMDNSRAGDEFSAAETVSGENEYEEVTAENNLHVDTLINYNAKNYRCIIDKRTTREKVIRTSFNEDGIGVDKVYHDNTISLKVYAGQALLLTKNFRKSDFAKYVDNEAFKQCILRDIEFITVSESGVLCQAIIAHPDSPAGFVVNIVVPSKGGYKLNKAE